MCTCSLGRYLKAPRMKFSSITKISFAIIPGGCCGLMKSVIFEIMFWIPLFCFAIYYLTKLFTEIFWIIFIGTINDKIFCQMVIQNRPEHIRKLYTKHSISLQKESPMFNVSVTPMMFRKDFEPNCYLHLTCILSVPSICCLPHREKNQNVSIKFPPNTSDTGY